MRPAHFRGVRDCDSRRVLYTADDVSCPIPGAVEASHAVERSVDPVSYTANQVRQEVEAAVRQAEANRAVNAVESACRDETEELPSAQHEDTRAESVQHRAAPASETDLMSHDALVNRVRNVLQRPEMEARLTSLGISGVSGDGGDAIIALVADLVAISNGNDGVQPAELAGSLVLDVVDATLDLTQGREDVEVERRRVLGVFFSALRALPAPGVVIPLPAPPVVSHQPRAEDSAPRQYKLHDAVRASLGFRRRGGAVTDSVRASGIVPIGPGSRSRGHRAGAGLMRPWQRVGVSASATGRLRRVLFPYRKVTSLMLMLLTRDLKPALACDIVSGIRRLPWKSRVSRLDPPSPFLLVC